VKELGDEVGVPRRKERLTIKSPGEEFETHGVQPRQRHDPQELKIYIKQLSKALKFLPLGGRAYYAVTGELLRADTQLKALVPTGSTMKGRTLAYSSPLRNRSNPRRFEPAIRSWQSFAK